jgi:lipopolysaccharide assembly protein A
MRYAYIALAVLITAAVLLFKFQNLSAVTVTLLSMNLTLPVSVFTVLVYVLGMMTGGALMGFMRTVYRGATQGRG